MGALQGSAEPDGHPQAAAHGPLAGATAGGAVMGMNPLVGHKVDRYWAEVRAPVTHRRTRMLACCCAKLDPAVQM